MNLTVAIGVSKLKYGFFIKELFSTVLTLLITFINSYILLIELFERVIILS